MATGKSGAFPFYMWELEDPQYDGGMPMGTGMPLPYTELVGATAIDQQTVRVEYFEEMEHSDPGTSTDTLNPSNYTFTGTVTITVDSVSLNQADPTIVDITINEDEMTNGAAYDVEVSNVLSLTGLPLDPTKDSAGFTGIGILPQVESASALDSDTIRLWFDELMTHDVPLQTPTNYTFSGPRALTASSATPADDSGKTYVDIDVNEEMTTGGMYSVRAWNVSDLAQNFIDTGNNTASFDGVGVPPQVEPDPVSFDLEYVRIRFNELMGASALVSTNYNFTPELEVTNVQKVIDDYTYELTTVENEGNTFYTLTLEDIYDIANNVIDPDHDTVTYTTPERVPPIIEMYPDSGTSIMNIRRNIKITARDDVEGHTGINISTWWIKVSYLDSNGDRQEETVMESDTLSTRYQGEKSGDPMDPVIGVSWLFRPKNNWHPYTQYNITSYVEDNTGNANVNLLIGYFSTGPARCFEDTNTEATAYDLAIINSIQEPNAEKLRQLMLLNSTDSTNRLIQARAVMHLATKTDMRVLVSDVLDLSLVDEITLCDRKPVLTTYTKIIRYKKYALEALKALPVTRELQAVLEQYLNSESSIYVVNAMAVIVILAALES